MRNITFPYIILLFIPWIVTLLYFNQPNPLFWISWAGSIYIFFLTWFSGLIRFDTDRPVSRQIMRPIFMTHFIFAGYMCVTSVFYFLDLLGYEYFTLVDPNAEVMNEVKIELTSKSQNYSLLGHMFFVLGMLLFRKAKKTTYYRIASRESSDKLLLYVTGSTFALGFLFAIIPGLYQFSISVLKVASMGGTFLFVLGVLKKDAKLLTVGTGLVVFNMVSATLTGFKESILVSVIIIGSMLFPYFKRTVIVIGIPILYVLLYLLPTYSKVFRNLNWSGEQTATEARSAALNEVLSTDKEDLENNNWNFLTERLSEISMFNGFVRTTPEEIDFYGFQIVQQSIDNLIPRVFWEDKPITEVVAMERVYAAGVISRRSAVSAKTRPVVDAYLSYGEWGIVFFMFIIGYILQVISDQCEQYLGGYQLGCIIVFNGLFQHMWRGNTFEFMINSLFYSYIMMWILFYWLKSSGYLVPYQEGDTIIEFVDDRKVI